MRPGTDPESELKNLQCVINIQRARLAKPWTNAEKRASSDRLLRDAVARLDDLRSGARERGRWGNVT